jgi:hypothetical protein
MNMRPPCSRDDVFEKLNSGEDEETAQRRIIDGSCLGRRFGRNHLTFARELCQIVLQEGYASYRKAVCLGWRGYSSGFCVVALSWYRTKSKVTDEQCWNQAFL